MSTYRLNPGSFPIEQWGFLRNRCGILPISYNLKTSRSWRRNKNIVISVKRASEAPPIIAVLIQDDLVSRVSKERIFSKDVNAIFSSLVIEAVQVA
jgi:hypothetical protein